MLIACPEENESDKNFVGKISKISKSVYKVEDLRKIVFLKMDLHFIIIGAP